MTGPESLGVSTEAEILDDGRAAQMPATPIAASRPTTGPTRYRCRAPRSSDTQMTTVRSMIISASLASAPVQPPRNLERQRYAAPWRGMRAMARRENSFPRTFPPLTPTRSIAISAGQRPENPNRKITYTGEGSGPWAGCFGSCSRKKFCIVAAMVLVFDALHGVKVQPTSATDGPHLADSHAFVIASGHWRRK